MLSKEEASSFALASEKKVYQSGEPVFINAFIRDESGNPVSGLLVNLQLSKTLQDSVQGRKNDGFSIVMDEAGNGQYSFISGALGEGFYSATAEISDNINLPVKKKFVNFVVEPYSVELADLRMNTVLLRNTAELSGGKMLEREALIAFLNELSLSPSKRTVKYENALWEKWWLLVIVLVLLCSEWLLRKRSNLP